MKLFNKTIVCSLGLIAVFSTTGCYAGTAVVYHRTPQPMPKVAYYAPPPPRHKHKLFISMPAHASLPIFYRQGPRPHR